MTLFENVTSLEKRPTQELLFGRNTNAHRQHENVVSLCDVAKQFKGFSLMILMYDLPLQNAIMIFFKKERKRKQQYIVKICAIEMVRFVKSHIFN